MGMSGEGYLELAIAPEEGVEGRTGVGERGLHHHSRHEGQGPGRLSRLYLDLEGFSDQRRS